MAAISLTRLAMPKTTADAWEPGPLRPRLAAGAVHVWRADLAGVSDDLIEVLSADERARAERFLNARDGVLWARAHGVLRALLGRYLEADPSRLRFVIGEHGKPALLDDSERPAKAGSGATRPKRLFFNLSHSGQLALCAVTDLGDVGVDIQVARPSINDVAVAERAFGPAEARRLQALESAIRKREFVRAWVRHEATLKCRGTGIGGAATETTGAELWVAELNVRPQWTAAVAVDGTPGELCSFCLGDL